VFHAKGSFLSLARRGQSNDVRARAAKTGTSDFSDLLPRNPTLNSMALRFVPERQTFEPALKAEIETGIRALWAVAAAYSDILESLQRTVATAAQLPGYDKVHHWTADTSVLFGELRELSRPSGPLSAFEPAITRLLDELEKVDFTRLVHEPVEITESEPGQALFRFGSYSLFRRTHRRRWTCTELMAALAKFERLVADAEEIVASVELECGRRTINQNEVQSKGIMSRRTPLAPEIRSSRRARR
jgi:hypothetical protein